MADWKYIMFEAADGTHIPILFPPILVHDDVARMMSCVVVNTLMKHAEPVSAGFVSGLIAASCNGKSVSMNDLKSRGAIDRALINEMPYAHGRTDGIACEPQIIEAALRILAPMYKGSEEAFEGDTTTTGEAVNSVRYQNGHCKGCNAPRKHYHRTGCPYEE